MNFNSNDNQRKRKSLEKDELDSNHNNNSNSKSNNDNKINTFKYRDRYFNLEISRCYYRLFLKNIQKMKIVPSKAIISDRRYLFFLYDHIKVFLIELFGDVITLDSKYYEGVRKTSFIIDDGSGYSIECLLTIDDDKPNENKLQSHRLKHGQFVRVWGHLDMTTTRILRCFVEKLEIVEDFNKQMLLWLQCIELHQTLYIPYSKYLAAKEEEKQISITNNNN